MKKIAIVFAVLMVFSVLPMTSFAGFNYIIENDTINMPNSEPTLDGAITYSDGWSKAADFDRNTVGYFWAHQPLTTTADLYFAYSNEGIYFAGDITERDYVMDYDEQGKLTEYRGNGFIYSTGYNDIDFDADGIDNYGWNGDIFTLMIDPMDVLANAGFLGNSDFTPWYNVGLFLNEDGSETAKVYRTKINNGELGEADGVRAAGATTEDGWIVEVFIPWSVIAKDVSDISYGSVSITADDIASDGTEFSAAIMYHDRFLDEESTMIDTWGRFITVSATCADGTPGHLSAGDAVKSLGLTLVNGDGSNPFIDVSDGKWYTDSILYCYRNGYMSGTSQNTFDYKMTMDRQMFATILAKIDGADISGYTNMSFSDVKEGQWYSNAIEWAYRNDYASGIGAGVYGRKNPITREQLALFFYTYSSKNGVDVSGVADLSGYNDADKIHEWAFDAVAWAVDCGLISGIGDNIISPRSSATRAEVSLIVMNYVTNVK